MRRKKPWKKKIVGLKAVEDPTRVRKNDKKAGRRKGAMKDRNQQAQLNRKGQDLL